VTPDVDSPVLSAVVMGYRNEKTILQSVCSLVEQKSDEPFEVLVVTSGGDRSADLVREHFPLMTVHESPTRLHPGAARNVGIRLARGEILAFLAADSLASPGWVAKRIAAHRAGHQVVAGAVSHAGRHTHVARAALFSTFPARLTTRPPGPADQSNVFGLSYTRSLLEQLGPFDEDLGTGEDTLASRRLRSLGVRAWFEPSIHAPHFGPVNTWQMVKEQVRRGARRAEWEDLLNAIGPRRLRLERMRWPGAGVFTVLLTAGYDAWGRWRWTIGSALRWANKRQVLPVLPWMLASGVANEAGWAAAQLGAQGHARREARALAAPPHWQLVRSLPTDGESRTVALTFDDGPSPTTTPAILDTLASYGVRATFFMLGQEAERHPDLVARAAAAGHSIGNHTWSHRYLTYDQDLLEAEVNRASELLGRLSGRAIRYIRPPGGRQNTMILAWLVRQGLRIVLWSIDPRDWSKPKPTAITSHVLERLEPGAVIVLHESDGDGAHTLAALPAIIDGILSRGYSFVPL
jgi:peptidoglycan/xylan/chitin deacetylase (PgdA/CDA1 family)/glycosyltransferase involved in cell wall biosynthesis